MSNAGFAPPIQRLLEQIVAALPPEMPAYLVGGAVRDLLCARPTRDLDFAVPGNAIRISRQLAKSLKAAFYPLDLERDTGRLILKDEQLGRLVIDFATLRGQDLESDLRDRDFTINAMAIDIRQPGKLLDPLGGARDLQAGILQPCSLSSFENDPIRILRAVRQSIEFKLKIFPETTRLMQHASPSLVRASAERLRDELFHILQGPAPASAMRILDTLGALPYVLPDLPALKGVGQPPPHTQDVWDHTLTAVQKLGEILNALTPELNPESVANWALGLVSLRLGRFRQPLHDHLAYQLNPERSLRALLILAALYHDVAKPQTLRVNGDGRVRFIEHERIGEQISRKRGQALHLSSSEVERLSDIVRQHMRLLWLAHSEELPSRRAVYRFFRDAGASGVDVCLLSLADTLATYGAGLSQETWIRQIEVIRILLVAWWEQPEERISPPALVNGNDLLHHLSLEPGPQIGLLLELIREAQAAGELHDREEALAFARAKLDQG